VIIRQNYNAVKSYALVQQLQLQFLCILYKTVKICEFSEKIIKEYYFRNSLKDSLKVTLHNSQQFMLIYNMVKPIKLRNILKNS
jgi:hypothetical protein